MNAAQTSTSLREVLYHFSLAKQIPDAELLDEYIRRYPEYAVALTAFAVDAVVDAVCADEDSGESVSATTVSPAVSRAMSRFQNKLFAVDNASTRHVSALVSAPEVANPFARLDAGAVRALAKSIRGNTVLVMKLRDREIDPDTITDGFCNRLATELDVPTELMVSHLRSAPTLAAHQMYKAERKPEAGPRQSFEDALRSSGLSPEEQEYLRNL